MTAPLPIGIIGAGIMGERLLRAILDQPADLVAVAGVWDPSDVALTRIASALPAIRTMPNPATLIAASECVYIASPPASHLGHARAALAAGKSVFCEKPLAVDVEDARGFVAEAGPRGAVNFPFASSPAVAALRGWIAEGVVGAIETVTIEVAFRTWPRPWQADAAAWLDATAQGGFTREVVSHFLFLTRRLVGPLQGLAGSAAFPEPGRSERAIAATLCAGDVPVTLRGDVGSTENDDHNLWTLQGENGAVRLRDWSIAERRQTDGSWQATPDALPNEKARPLALKRQLEGVVAMARGEPHHLATLQEALEVQEIVEAMLQGR
jgi:predicted dehydrogenase